MTFLAVLLAIQTQTTKLEVKDGVVSQQFNEYIMPSSNVIALSFTPGPSIAQLQEKELQISRDRVRPRAVNAGRQTQQGSVPYVRGYCTWYVATQKNISTSFGDARNWPINSQEPQVGEVVVTKESPRGHVALIEEVNGDDITISEMNYVGWNQVSRRTINKNSWFIKGYLVI